ncbi:MAG TPA: hypothetical protein VMH22_08030 [bacterium]|nr:hypothetical protein [bacterium]
MVKMLLRMFLPAAVLLTAAGCGQPKEAPVISWIGGYASVMAGDSVIYRCQASDPNMEQLSYFWSQEGGRLGWDWSDSVRWFAPESSGEGKIRVTVTNEDGLTASDSLSLAVRAETAGVLDWDAAVKAGEFAAWPVAIRAGYKLYGTCGSDTGNIFLMVLDDSSFTRWVAGGSVSPLLRRAPYSTNDTFSVRTGADGLYHIVMDNTGGSGDYNYRLDVWKAGP